MRVNTISKLTFLDTVHFDALVRDIFPGTALSDVSFPALADAIAAVAAAERLTLSPAQTRKALELYELLRQRMGVVVVGPAGSGKSTIRRVLMGALQKWVSFFLFSHLHACLFFPSSSRP